MGYENGYSYRLVTPISNPTSSLKSREAGEDFSWPDFFPQKRSESGQNERCLWKFEKHVVMQLQKQLYRKFRMEYFDSAHSYE
jgi:hypothetical protein